jgi:hypothetical protein
MDLEKFVKKFQQYFNLFELEEIARETGFVKRIPKKICPMNFFVALFLSIFSGKNTYSNNAKKIATLIGDTLSRQAVFKRTKPETVEWLKRILMLAIYKTAEIKQQEIFNLDVFNPFNRVILHDSTNISVPAKLYQFFGGSKNQTNKTTATLKIQGYFNILKENFCHFDITPYTKNDQSAAHDVFDVAQRFDLIIRDLGYFSSKVFKQIVENSFFFISRLRLNTTVYLEDRKTKLNLLKYLKQNMHLEYLSLNVFVSDSFKVPVRLIANKLPHDVAEQRRKKEKNHPDRRRNINKENLELLGWEIYITNILSTVWDDKTVCDVYRLRWRIEIIFKAWKSFFQIAAVPQARLERVECHIYFTLIAITLFHSHLYIKTVEMAYLRTGQFISLLKFYNYFKEQVWHWTQIFTENNGVKNFIEFAIYYCRYDKRIKRISYPQALMALG